MSLLKGEVMEVEMDRYIPKCMQVIGVGLMCCLAVQYHFQHQETIQQLREAYRQKEAMLDTLQVKIKEMEEGREESEDVLNEEEEKIPEYTHEAYGVERLMAVTQGFKGVIHGIQQGEAIEDESLRSMGIQSVAYTLNIAGVYKEVETFIHYLASQYDMELIEVQVDKVEDQFKAQILLQIYSQIKEGQPV